MLEGYKETSSLNNLVTQVTSSLLLGIRQTNWVMMSKEFDDPSSPPPSKVCDQG